MLGNFMEFIKKYKNYSLILAMFLLLNLSFWAIAEHYGLNRILFNVDFLLLSLFFYYKNRLNAFLLFCAFLIFCFIEILLFGLQVFPFISLNDIVYFSSFIFNGPVLYAFVVIGAIIAVIFVYCLIHRFVVKNINLTKKDWLGIVAISFVLLMVSVLSNSNILTSQSYFLIKNQNLSMVDIAKDGKVLEELTSDYASKPLLTQIQSNQLQSDKILFIVSESWSETAKPEQQQAILKAIYAQKDKFEFIHQGHFTAVGATVTGEIRELCQKRLMAMDTRQISADELKGCIPNLLKNKGYNTYSVYSGYEGLYSPEYWYPLAGLDKRYFAPDLPNGGECKYYNSRCDILLVDKVKELLLSSEKSFVYWLTLNTHAPYNDIVFIDGFDCNVVGLETGTAVCNNYKLHYQFFTALAQMIEDPQLKGIEVYIVGDHPAPITDLRDGLKAFKGSDVAWLHFKIKGDE